MGWLGHAASHPTPRHSTYRILPRTLRRVPASICPHVPRRRRQLSMLPARSTPPTPHPTPACSPPPLSPRSWAAARSLSRPSSEPGPPAGLQICILQSVIIRGKPCPVLPRPALPSPCTALPCALCALHASLPPLVAFACKPQPCPTSQPLPPSPQRHQVCCGCRDPLPRHLQVPQGVSRRRQELAPDQRQEGGVPLLPSSLPAHSQRDSLCCSCTATAPHSTARPTPSCTALRACPLATQACSCLPTHLPAPAPLPLQLPQEQERQRGCDRPRRH